MITVRKVSENATSVLLGWDVVPGAAGFKFTVEFPDKSKVSHTWDGSRTTVRVDKTAVKVTVEALEVLDTGVWPPIAPPGFTSPLGFLSNRTPGYFPATHIDQYGVISAEGPAPAAFRGVNLVYRSTITCGNGYTNMSEQECLSRGWAMVGTDGKVMRNIGYGGVLGDPGHPAYRQRWLELTLDYMARHQADSYWGDDFTARVADFNGGVWPQKYPSMQAYQQQALLPFATWMKAELANRGVRNGAYNAAISLDDDASQTRAWWANLGQHVGYLTCEYWEIANGHVRRDASGWDNNWAGFRALHGVCQQAGCEFLPFPSGIGQVYTLATFLLDWDGKHGALMWVPAGQGGGEYNSTTDPWIAEYGKAMALGQPIGAAAHAGGVWRRAFEHGTVTVDAVAGTAAIG